MKSSEEKMKKRTKENKAGWKKRKDLTEMEK